MRKQKVLIVYQHLPHYREGVFRQLDSDDDLSVTFAADTSSRDGSIPTIDPGTLTRFHRLKNVWLGPFLWQRGLASLILMEDFDDVVFLGDWKYLSTWMGQLLAHARRSRVFLWTIGWHRPDTGLKRLLRLHFYRLSSGLLLYGTDGRGIGIATGYPPEKMHVIGNSHVSGLEPESASDVPAQRSDGTFTVGAVVRLQPVKRLDLLLHAAALLQDLDYPVHVLLVGEGPERERLDELASQLGVTVEFTGAVYDSAMLRSIYSRLDLTVLPEAAGLTVMQSLSHGVPVVTSDSPYTQMPEFRAVVDDVTGSLYVPGDVQSMADNIIRWKQRLGTAEERHLVASACVSEIRQNWTPRVHADRILRVIKR